ncbi:HHR170Cp [Eremothecium sinecaudum]|uniref:4a-hydroxytetrahydrobiopterin dehydratase n=1 Tax=Eremothecium sinecaudum TaxID=45286 RepID=A0A0X8HWT3_9SACH|nr:HHR170Cp [Eremothecium sinecaudum]AMD22939.1 HHR170Cp [Eremothecium sinecaudum]
MYNKVIKQAPVLFNQAKLEAELAGLTPWKYVNGSLHRDVELTDFETTWAFLNKIAMRSHLWGHHPTLTTTYNRVSISLTTHDAGGVTNIDVKMAKQIEKYLTKSQ